ncbi:hypothetical protein GNY06_00855 [Elizabethkingia argentiflava]|uniref:Uncharacterized protein n=1 Tax=Elizabethkingia argenteiflava TaxID=2681556 RepID=A0A845PPF7_9FLAO|nr:hypothetical protein [Elizabethkingia argenteiflava]NAW50002.1 hypothetical protein [Elizabethkingia argenteiflava]
MAHQGIYVDNEEVDLIRDLLYLMAKNHKKIEGDENIETLTGIRTNQETY